MSKRSFLESFPWDESSEIHKKARLEMGQYYKKNYKKSDPKQKAAYAMVNAYAYGGFKGKPVQYPANNDEHEKLKAALRCNLSVLHGKLQSKAKYANNLKRRANYNRMNRQQGQAGIVNVH